MGLLVRLREAPRSAANAHGKPPYPKSGLRVRVL